MAFRATFNAIDKTDFVRRGSGFGPTVTLKQNERSQAVLTLLPGFTSAKFDPVILYDVDGTTPVFGGIVLQRGTESFERGSFPHLTNVTCSDFMTYTDWAFWSKTYAAPVTLKAVLQDLIADKLGAYGITLDAAQDTGPTLAPFTVGAGGVGAKVSDLLRDLGKACVPPRVSQMSPLKALRMLVPGTNAAPFAITDATPRCLDFNWEDSSFTPANKVTLICGPTGTGTPTQSWTVGAPSTWEVDIQAVVGGWNQGFVEEVGLGNRSLSGPGGGGYYEFAPSTGRGTLSIGSGVKAANGVVLKLVYTAIYPFSVSATSGASPVIEQQATDVAELLLAPAQAKVNGMLAELDQSPREASILTLDRGFLPNQSLPVTLAVRGVSGATFSITEVGAEFTEFYNLGEKMWVYTLRASETTVYQGSYLDQMRGMLSSGGTAGLTTVGGSSGGVGGGASYYLGGSETLYRSSPTPTWVAADAVQVVLDTVTRGSVIATVSVRLRAVSGSVTARLQNITNGTTAGTSTAVTSTSWVTVTFVVALTAGARTYELQILPSAANVDVAAVGYLE